jgi:hypothetical protein
MSEVEKMLHDLEGKSARQRGQRLHLGFRTETA